MEYKLNPSEISNVFVVPASVVDDDLRLAGSTHLKVLLWTLRHAKHENATLDELSEELKINKPDLVDAMQFWIDRGVIIKYPDSGEPAMTQKAPSPAKEKPSAAAVSVTPPPAPPVVSVSAPADIPMSKPSIDQIAVRCKESGELRDLFDEVQKQLGRTIGYDGQSILLMMYDTYGLPVPVIIMAVEYALSQGKNSLKYIAGIGKQWCEKEIDTLEKAMQFIEDMNECDGIWERFRQLTGLSNPKPTAKQRGYLLTWTRDYGFNIDMIYSAYEEMADHTQKFSMQYIDKVLLNWKNSGIKTTDDVEQAKAAYESGKKPTANEKNNSKEHSYDIEEYERKARSTVPVYRKKKAE
ncbi:MAG: DnaD domain protein [Clostridia bacterium]|nr:DnaD domain protein [Clostridia bacterium]